MHQEDHGQDDGPQQQGEGRARGARPQPGRGELDRRGRGEPGRVSARRSAPGSGLRRGGRLQGGLLQAGEVPELCLRLRQAGWRIRRIDAEMTLHDAAITRFSQWWTRMVRSGHAYAQGFALHPGFHARENASIVLWSVGWPR